MLLLLLLPFVFLLPDLHLILLLSQLVKPQIPADGLGNSVLALCQKEQWQVLLLPRPPLQ